jgi:translation initiation factor 3 subunit K
MSWQEKRYDLDQSSVIEELEADVKKQMSDVNYYNQEGNLHLLKCYKLSPAVQNVDVLVSVLLKSLTTLPRTDFLLCACLLREQVTAHADVASVLSIWRDLEAAKFESFWQKAAAEPLTSRLNSVPGFFDSIRQYIVQTLSITYSALSVDDAKRMLDAADDELLDALAEQHQWTVANGQVTLKRTEHNQHIPVPASEAIEFRHLAAMRKD